MFIGTISTHKRVYYPNNSLYRRIYPEGKVTGNKIEVLKPIPQPDIKFGVTYTHPSEMVLSPSNYYNLFKAVYGDLK